MVASRAAEPVYDIDIPAMNSAEALNRFAEQTGSVMLFSYDLASARQANAVRGRYTLLEGMELLLRNTGLSGGLSDKRVVIIAANGNQPAGEGGSVKKRSLFAGIAAVLASALAADAKADQDQTEAAPVRLEEIRVTAQKREEQLQDVPISISVLSGADLDRSTVEGVSEALSRVPGVLITEANQGNVTQLTVRGVSSALAHFFGTGVAAYYLDWMPFGAFISASVPDSNAYDLDRVEVLRGPQGTLYGAGALNGVVRVLTNDADLDDFELKARATLSSTEGGDESYRGDVAVNLPLLPGKLAARIVAGYDDRGGWIDKPNQKDANDGVIKNLRLRVNAQPTDALSIGLMAWLSREDYDGPNTSDEPGQSSSTAREFSSAEFDMYGLKIGYDFSSLALTSATSYFDDFNHSEVDGLFGAAIPGFPPINSLFDGDMWAEELTLISTHGGPWRWSLGSLYREADQTFEQYIIGLSTPVPTHFSSESLAVFGEATRSFHDGEFELTGGLRYFEDTQRTDTGGPEDEAKFDGTSPRVVFTWHASERLTAYASYSEGFRSGAPQGADVASQGIPPLEPDTLINYEIGAKGVLWGGQLSFDTAVFYMDWQDVQESLTVLNPQGIPISARVNGDSASGLGVDFAATLVPVDGLALGVTVGWNDLTMDSDVFTGNAQDILLRAAGERFNYSPEWTTGFWLDYDFPLGGAGFNGRFSTSANFTSEQIFSLYLFGSERSATSGEDMVVARASFGIEAPRDWSATLFIDNLTDEEGPPLYDPLEAPLFTPRIRPRTIGVQFEYHFGN